MVRATVADCCARVTLFLALPPLAFAVWYVMVEAGGWHELRASLAVATAIMMALVILIWWRYVRWTALRIICTAAVALLVCVQPLVCEPLWDAAFVDMFVFLGQSLALLGLGLIVCALLWWAPILWKGKPAYSRPLNRRFQVTASAVRLVIGLALLPFMAGLFFVLAIALWDLFDLHEDTSISIAYGACMAFGAGCWLLLWRRVVSWNSRRRRVTAFLLVLLLASPALIFCAEWVARTPLNDAGGLLCSLAPVLAYALWLAGTAWAWRSPGVPELRSAKETDRPVGAVPFCPTCNYNLTGLREVRCPECGWTSSIDDVVHRTLAAVLSVP